MIFPVVHGIITTTNQNAVFVVGSTVTFSCTTNTTNPIRWIRYAPSSTKDMILYNGERVHPNFTDRLRVATSDSHVVLKSTV